MSSYGTVYSSATLEEDLERLSTSSYLTPSPPPSLNPFLAPGEVIAVVAEPAHRPAERVHLPPFWPTRPAAWFGAAEAAFSLRRVVVQRDMFSYCIAVLGEDQLIQVADLLEICPPPADAYSRLKQRLVSTHVLDEYQRLELLHELPPLGGQRPSVLLAEMRQLCPSGEADTKLFRSLFLRRLPQSIRMAISEDQLSPIQAIAARADALMAHTGGNLAAAAVASSLPVVAAASASSRTVDRKKKTSSQPHRRDGDRRPQTGDRRPRTICHYHFKFGSDAHSCEAPCDWKSGN